MFCERKRTAHFITRETILKDGELDKNLLLFNSNVIKNIL